MELYTRVYQNLIERRDRVINGLFNSIPLGFTRFSEELPGIEQKTIYHVTANTKVGKTQISDYLFLYTPFFFAFRNRDKMRLKIFYFTLEMSKEQKYMQFMCHLIFILSKGAIRVTPRDLRSVDSNNPLSQDILDILASEPYKEYFQFFEETVVFIDNIKNPFGIYKFMRNYAKTHGVQHTKMMKFVDEKTGEESEQEVDDYYKPYDPEEYVICTIDHLALLSPENGGNVRDAMVKFSSDYAITLRNKYKYILDIVIQQAAAQESLENFKNSKLKPTLDGYGDAKIVSRDADVIIGLFSPFRHALPMYEGYDITKFRDNIRFMEIIAGREGGGGTVCPLLFDGGTNFFSELPLPNNNEGILNSLNLVDRIRNGGIILRSGFVNFLYSKGDRYTPSVFKPVVHSYRKKLLKKLFI